MTRIPPADERALSVLRQNRYFVLSTYDEDGPWTAALAFTPALPSCLYFVSRTWARHSKAIGFDNRVSGVIFDSRLPIEEVESIQFSGQCEEISDFERTRATLIGHPAENGETPEDRIVEDLLKDTDLAAYCVTIEDAYVLDQEAWLNSQIDAREPTDIKKVFSVFLASFG